MLQLQDFKEENSRLKAETTNNREALEATDKELRRLQDKHRDLLVDANDLKAEKDKYQVETKLADEKLRESEKKSNQLQDSWEREKKDLEARMVGLIKSVEKYQADPTTSREQVNEYKRKANEYKKKLAMMNQLVEKMGTVS